MRSCFILANKKAFKIKALGVSQTPKINYKTERRETMKKISCFILILVIVFGVVGCGKKVVCGFCEEEKSGQTVTVLGEEVDVCNDCMEQLQTGF